MAFLLVEPLSPDVGVAVWAEDVGGALVVAVEVVLLLVAVDSLLFALLLLLAFASARRANGTKFCKKEIHNYHVRTIFIFIKKRNQF